MNVQSITDLTVDDSVSTGFVCPGQTLPLVYQAKHDCIDLVEWAAANKDMIKEAKEKYGAVLFRGFNVDSAQQFEQVIAATSSEAIEYLERSSPREAISGNVYTSTSQPKESEIFLHTEQSFNLNFPLHIYFNCHIAAEKNGRTPLADTRKIFNRLSSYIKKELIEKGYIYQRNFMKHMYLSWQDCYQTHDKNLVEQYCQANNIELKWGDSDIALTTRQKRPVVSRHPATNEYCWFNHCTFFNVAALTPMVQSFLLNSYSLQELPNHTFYGDGTEIEAVVIEALIAAYDAEKVTFEWKKGDVLMVDNMLVAHGRESFEGERLVLTGMSEPISLADVSVSSLKGER